MRNMMWLWIVLFGLMGCETGYKGEQNATTSEGMAEAQSQSAKPQYTEDPLPLQKFEGGYINDGLNIKNIRISQGEDKVRMVFDHDYWENSDKKGQKVKRVGVYTFVYSPEKRLITATIEGYRSFTADFPEFSKNSLIEKMYMDKYLDDSGYRFYIKLRDDVKINVFDLENPARIVLDIELF